MKLFYLIFSLFGLIVGWGQYPLTLILPANLAVPTNYNSMVSTPSMFWFESQVPTNAPYLLVPMSINNEPFLYSYQWDNNTLQFLLVKNVSASVANLPQFLLVVSSTQSPTGSPLLFFTATGAAGYIDLWSWKSYTFMNSSSIVSFSDAIFLPSSPNLIFIVNYTQLCIWNIQTLQMIGEAQLISTDYDIYHIYSLMNIDSHVFLFISKKLAEIYNENVLFVWDEMDFINLNLLNPKSVGFGIDRTPVLGNLPYQNQLLSVFGGCPALTDSQLNTRGLPCVNASSDEYVQIIDGTTMAILDAFLQQEGFYVYDLMNPTNPSNMVFYLLANLDSPYDFYFSQQSLSVPQEYKSMYPFNMVVQYQASNDIVEDYILLPFAM